VVSAALHVQRRERRAAPARPVSDQAEVVPGMPLAPLALPLLPVQVEKRGGDDLGVELGRREVWSCPGSVEGEPLSRSSLHHPRGGY
jgi:hypothetical protein